MSQSRIINLRKPTYYSMTKVKPKTDKYGQPLTYIQQYIKKNDYPIVNEVIDDILNRIKEKP